MKFKDWFMQEQQTLRELGDDFVEDDPRLAPVLGRTASDPASEYLMEHFAFLTARLVMKIEDHLPELTHPLLQLLYRHEQIFILLASALIAGVAALFASAAAGRHLEGAHYLA